MDQPRPQTALPRLSKLPQPRSFADNSTQLPRPSTPTRGNDFSKRTSMAIPRPGSSMSSGIKPPGNANRLGQQRQPLGPTRRPQSQAVTSFDYNAYEDNKSYYIDDRTSSGGSDASDVSPSASPNSTAPKTIGMRKPRVSLSDRTIESLSYCSPAPPSGRRQSSFFNPQSPMTSPQRPPSSAATTRPHAASVSRLTYGGIRPPTANGRTSPQKSALPAPQSGIATRPMSGVPKNTVPGSNRVPANRTNLPANGLARPRPANMGHQRAMSAVPPRTQVSAPTPKPGLKKPIGLTKPARPMSTIGAPAGMTEDLKIARPRPAPAAAKRPELPTEDTAANFQKSSNSLREQIAKAKAAHRATQMKQEASPSSYAFEDCEDPFGQKKSDENGSLLGRIDNARRDGRLNIAGMGYKTIPEEVMQMYEAAAMETSSVAWNETVDLVRFNAADNEIAQLADDVFPDIDKETLMNDPDSKGMQFGGIEVLDLHGNLLTGLPRGIHRLERLTTLNLARNDLENSIFDIVTQIPSLRELNLSGNKLSDKLPDTIGQLVHLETLNLSGNKLNLLPGSLRELESLHVLDVSQNRLSMLDLSTLCHLPLTELYASYNALTGALFPTNVTTMERLEVLEVSNNSLASLSFTSLLLPALKQLNVSANRLVMLPDMSQWTRLISCLAEENMLTQFPDGFTSLKTNLKKANFERNNITRIEEGIALMEGLDALSLAGNPIRERKYLTMNCHDIKRDLKKRLSAPTHDSETF